MNIIKFDVELTGNKEVLINGKNCLTSGSNPFVDEKIFVKQLSKEQQHAVMAMARQLAEIVYSANQEAMVRRGEISENDIKKLVF
jgi:hypothetical protein